MIPLVGSGASKFAEQLGRELSPNSLDKQREKMSEIMRGSPRTIVVLIDDIDRLEFDEIVTILKIVRLNANLPRLIYVLAFDDAMVSVAIGSKYGGGPDAGRQFLEKIVQYPFTLPSVGHDRLVKFVVERAVVACEGASVELSDQEWKQFQQLMDRHLARRLRTPRQAIRYANALEFALPMLKGDANSYEQILVEGLRVLFPELYELLRDDVRSFADLDRTNTVRVLDLKRLSSSVRRSIKTRSDDDISAGEELIKELFDDSSRLDSIVRPINFNRYFSYALDATETLDKDIIDAIDHSSDYSKLAVNFRLYDRMPDRIIDLLYGMNLGARYSSDQRADRFLTILRALALSGSLFVAEPDKLLFKMMWREDKKGVDTNPLVDRVEQLIGDIVRLLDYDLRSSVAALIILSADLGIFAIRLYLHFMRKMRYDSIRSADFESAVVTRIKALPKKIPRQFLLTMQPMGNTQTPGSHVMT
jgi:KAP-like P-loop domain-containing protein